MLMIIAVVSALFSFLLKRWDEQEEEEKKVMP